MKLILLCFWMGGTSSFSCSVSRGIGLFKSNSLTGVGACSAAFETSFRGRCLLHLLTGLAVGAVVVSCPKTPAKRWSLSILSGVLSSGSTPGISMSSGEFIVLPSYVFSFLVGEPVNLSSTQKFSRNKQAGGGAYIPATLRIVGPTIHAQIVLERVRKTLCECENEVEMSVEML